MTAHPLNEQPSKPCENAVRVDRDAFDASNAVRLCGRCEQESGVSAGADVGDRACAVCGSHEAPHIYPLLGTVPVVLVDVQEVAEALRHADYPLAPTTLNAAADFILRRFAPESERG